MRITIVAPSEQYMALAGVRIRYRRIASRLENAGHTFEIMQISDFDRRIPMESDAYVFSKCYDARSFLAATAMRGQGRHVGIDVFDDYFDQSRDSQFVRHREWLRTMGELCDFFLCSTPRMHEVVKRFLPDAPGHVLNDPFHAFDVKSVGDMISEKLVRARRERHIDVLWFGVGDNPNFHIGLKDLAAYGDNLQQLRRRGFDVSLRILTNRRALDLEGLKSISRLAVAHSVEEWSQARETELLAQSLLAFIPVNAQAFSIAKSLNRAVTALTGGAQVLSPGYPLYQPLEEFIYDTADGFIDDVEAARLKVRRATTAALSNTLATWGDPGREGEKLIEFMQKIVDRPTAVSLPKTLTGVLHGLRSPVDCHKAAQRLGQLSIAGQVNAPKLNYDVRFVIDADGAQVQFSAAAKQALHPDLRQVLTPAASPSGKTVDALRLNDALPGHPLNVLRAQDGDRATVSAYIDSVHLIEDAVQRLFPGIRVYLSELDAPFLNRPAGRAFDATHGARP
jgi:hypothetical protein